MKKFGWTVSEIAIAVMVVGICACLTIPMFLENTNKQQFAASLKNTISALDQALEHKIIMGNLTANDFTDNEEIAEALKEKLHVAGSAKEKVVFTNTTLCPDTDDNGKPTAVFKLNNGVYICIKNFSNKGCKNDNVTPCTISGEDKPNVFIDVNSEKKKNKLAELLSKPDDIYQAQIYNQKIVAWGDISQHMAYDRKYNGSH
ncbi:hypothetical protein II906_03685 [bacterium]|nr:hypothetical protein [bacterium]